MRWVLYLPLLPRPGAPAPLGLQDAQACYQRHLLGRQQQAAAGEQQGPRIDGKAMRALEEMDLSKISHMLPRQSTAVEIDRTVRAIRAYTKAAAQIPQLVTNATAGLQPDAAMEAGGNVTFMASQLREAFASLQRAATGHRAALEQTFAVAQLNSGPHQAREQAVGMAALRHLAQGMVDVTARARAALADDAGAEGLCSNASSVLSDLRRRARTWAKLCEDILFKLPPPLPEMNPWINATLLEAMRSMYTTGRNAVRDLDDNVVGHVSTFLYEGLDCDVEVDETLDTAEEIMSYTKAELHTLQHALQLPMKPHSSARPALPQGRGLLLALLGLLAAARA